MGEFLHSPPNMQPVAIYNDGGGLVTAYEEAAFRYAREGREVQIRGQCRSACILALSVPKVCVVPGAVVKAHNAYEQFGGTRRPDITQAMLSKLPSKIQMRLNGKVRDAYWAGSILDYNELMALGIRRCGSSAPVAKKPKAPAQVTSCTWQLWLIKCFLKM
jgi:hypothetical protein